MAERIKLNSKDENPKLVDAFVQLAKEENAVPNPDDGRTKPQLRRDPVWLKEFQFKPGQSGNPEGGRPKERKVSIALANQLAEIDPETGRTNCEVIAAAMIARAKRGEVYAARTIYEITEGFTQRVELTGELNVIEKSLTNASNEELDAVILAWVQLSKGEEGPPTLEGK